MILSSNLEIMKIKLIVLLLLAAPSSMYAADYEYIDASSRVGIYWPNEKILNPNPAIPSSNWPTWEYYCKDWYAKVVETWSSKGQWEPDHSKVVCLNKGLYDQQKAQKNAEEEARKKSEEIQKNTINTTATSTKNLEDFNKAVEEAKKALEQKTQTGVISNPANIPTETRKLSIAWQRKAILLKKRIELFQKQINQLQKQLDEIK